LEQVLKTIDRQTTIECARACRKHGIRESFGFIFGFPEETEADIRAHFSLMEEVTDIQGEFDCIYHFFAPRPGTELSEASLRRGAVTPGKLEDWISYNTFRGITPWVDERYIDRIRRYCDYHYPFARPGRVFRKRMCRRASGRVFFRLVHLINRVRYLFRFYGLPLDWWFYKKFRRMRSGSR
jgi:radical SAM superfamily enzyme YgiQ (UPF0313 family)